IAAHHRRGEIRARLFETCSFQSQRGRHAPERREVVRNLLIDGADGGEKIRIGDLAVGLIDDRNDHAQTVTRRRGRMLRSVAQRSRECRSANWETSKYRPWGLAAWE